jgi:hypothetical protein
MLRMLNAFLTVQALHVAAELGLADLLAGGPKSGDDLAADTEADPASLHRLLRMLTGSGVFQQEADGSYALTTLGATLKSDAPDSVREWALFVGAPEMWLVWAGLRESVLTGRSSFAAVHGVPMWKYIANHEKLGQAFNGWMTRQSHQHNSALVAAYDFSPLRHVVDVGGGQGSTLAAILRANPGLRGVLLDLPAVVATTSPLEAAGVADRCEVIGGDMLRAVPAGGDAYIAKRVLMDWSDADSTTILRNCREAMTEDGKVLVIEMLMPSGNEPSPARSFDLLMLLNQPGGRIRTEAEFRELFAGAGLRLSRVVATASPNSILEGARA